MTFTTFVLAFAAFTLAWNVVVIWFIGLELTRWLKRKRSNTQMMAYLKWPAKPENNSGLMRCHD